MSRDKRTSRWIFVLAAASAAYALTLFATGGFDADVLGMRIRSRAWERPAAVSCVLFVLAFAVSHRRLADRGVSAWAAVDTPASAWALTMIAIAWALFAGFRYGTFVAGGADSFGYVSQAELFARGRLTDEIPMRAEFAWRDASLSLIPLGYRPAAQPGRMAPVYPPGLPLLMASLRPFGDGAVYAVVPLLGAGVLACVAILGRRLGDPLAGGIAALALSASATFLLMQVSPMSDVPVTALWLGALVAATATCAAAPAFAGLLTGVAVLTRPNLAPLALAIAAALTINRPFRARAVGAFLAPLGAALAMLLWMQWRRYGDPFASGYGATGDLFAIGHVAPNLASYASRVTALYTPIIWLCLAAPILAKRGSRSRLTWVTLAMIAAVWLAYLPYQPWEAWFFTRFLLPAIPLMLVLAIAVVMAGIRASPPWLRTAATLAVVVGVTTALAHQSDRRGVLDAAVHEQKYRDAGHFVRDRLPPDAYVLARQHSGSARFYSGRPTIRWDVIGGDQLDTVASTVRAIGSSLYLVIDEDELPVFERHFEGQATSRRLNRLAQFGQARVYAVE